ncbi:hypothetical protein FKG94_25080 [Exilibacterium tricleocarpae]|uniref:DNA repair protein n=1 Tax=Exilibacterium tricleocarpae TaxID=2591008 RepID=A0A545SS77_9GAMM|nr:hypothetical protein [Exilibacterium tricleocarpae]TQV67805.1 hypothetical protein FKG94_25080 [Exilibacterium tricleocarpae]
MSVVYITTAIAVLAAALVGYAVMSQTVNHRRKSKQRLVTALKVRLRNFKHMLDAFPADFLTRELTVLLHKCLIDVCEQLSKLEPDTPAFLKESQHYASQLQALQATAKANRSKGLENPQQAKEVRHYLQELDKFIAQLTARRSISAEQAKLYRHQIKQLTLQLSVDAHTRNAKQAQQSGKARLAIHHYTLAHKLLAGANDRGIHQQKLDKLAQVIKQLEAKAAKETPQSTHQEEQSATAEAWDNFGEDESWKKKKLYD